MQFDFPYIGSFQRGRLHRTGDPLGTVWRHIERVGTVDNLTRIAKRRNQDASLALSASLRIRQAVELRIAARGTSALSRPLLLYYSSLNLARGMMMIFAGHMGASGHGLKYVGAEHWLNCSARTTKKGTFREFTETLGISSTKLQDKQISLRDALAQIPELLSDFSLLEAGLPRVTFVEIRAIMRGAMTLKLHVTGITEPDFRSQWASLFPWFSDSCECGDEAFTLKLKTDPKDAEEIATFCEKHLLHDLNWREDAVWYDHIAHDDVLLLPRLSGYLVALFILSNMCRYEPQTIDTVARNPTNAAFVLNTFLDHVERYFPQLVLEALHGNGMYFT